MARSLWKERTYAGNDQVIVPWKTGRLCVRWAEPSRWGNALPSYAVRIKRLGQLARIYARATNLKYSTETAQKTLLMERLRLTPKQIATQPIGVTTVCAQRYRTLSLLAIRSRVVVQPRGRRARSVEVVTMPSSLTVRGKAVYKLNDAEERIWSALARERRKRCSGRRRSQSRQPRTSRP